METLTYGELPVREQFILHVTPQLEEHGGGYPMVIRDQPTWAVIAAAVNVGIDSHLEAVDLKADSTTGVVMIKGAESLYTLLRRLVEGKGSKGHKCTETCRGERYDGEHCTYNLATGLVGAVLGTLGYEWV